MAQYDEKMGCGKRCKGETRIKVKIWKMVWTTQHSRFTLYRDEKIWEYFDNSQRVAQGCTTSPTLFKNNLMIAIEAAIKHVR